MVFDSSSFLFTDSLYVVNKTTFEYIFVELYDNTEININLILNKTSWFKTDDIECCFENSIFWKMQHNKLIKSGYVNEPEFKIDPFDCKDYIDLDYIGIVSIFDTESIESVSIWIDSLLEIKN